MRAAHKVWLRALEATAPITRDASLTFPVLLNRLAEKFGSAPALLSERECLTYEGLAQRSGRFARWAFAQKIKSGDVVCLLMSNCPDYMAIWLGVTRIGGAVALLNTSLVSDSLVRAIKAAAPRHLIVGAELCDNVAAVRSRLAPDIKIWGYGGGEHAFQPLDEEIARARAKAALVSHFRLMQWTHWFAGLMDLRPSDRIYDCLPMYHGIGGVVATGARR